MQAEPLSLAAQQGKAHAGKPETDGGPARPKRNVRTNRLTEPTMEMLSASLQVPARLTLRPAPRGARDRCNRAPAGVAR